MATVFRHLLLGAALAAAPAGAQGFEDLNALEQRLTAALGADVGQPGGPAQPIDRRMKLAACPTPATFDPPALGAIAVRCDPLGWRIRVPMMRAAATFASAPAAKAEPIIRKGDQVEIEAQGAAFTVSAVVIAEQDGAPGQRIRVRSAERKAPAFLALVTEDGRVTLPGLK